MFLSRRRLFLLVVIFLAVFLLFLLPDSLLSPSVSNPQLSGRAIVTLASSHTRLDVELPIALRSLTLQNARPKEIRVYLPENDRELVQSRLKHKTGEPHALSPYLLHPEVKLIFARDVGPATKFIPLIKELLERAETGETDLLDQPVIVVDDDHSYSPSVVSSLLEGHALLPNASVGLRGWRIRQDLHWGVTFDEINRHVQYGYKLAQPYRVGVLTANEGYLVTPRFFLLNPTPASGLVTSAPLIDTVSMSSTAARLVDDIWMAGSLATKQVSRYVVPLSGPASLDVTVTHPLETHMASQGSSRSEANDETLQLFGSAFAAEGIWYRFASEVTWAKGVTSHDSDEPVWVSPVARARKKMQQMAEMARLKVVFKTVKFH